MINLARSLERRRDTADRLASLGLDAEFVGACDDAALVPARAGTPGLSALEAACLQSHLRVLDAVTRSHAPLACIIEDDCDLQPPFADVLRVVCQRPAQPWDVLLLGHHSARHGDAEGAETCFRGTGIIAGYREARVAEFPMGAYAYVVTREGARRLIAHANPPRMPADWVTGYCEAAGARLYAVTPPCVRPLPVAQAPTTIDDRAARSGPVQPAATPDRSIRARGGRVLLWLRKLGIRPGSYARHF